VRRPRANLDLVYSQNQVSYTFNNITLMNRRRLVTGAERYSVFEFNYVDGLTHQAGRGATNPLVLTNAQFPLQQVAHHCKQTVTVSGTTAKRLLGVEAHQDTQGAA